MPDDLDLVNAVRKWLMVMNPAMPFKEVESRSSSSRYHDCIFVSYNKDHASEPIYVSVKKGPTPTIDVATPSPPKRPASCNKLLLVRLGIRILNGLFHFLRRPRLTMAFHVSSIIRSAPGPTSSFKLE